MCHIPSFLQILKCPHCREPRTKDAKQRLNLKHKSFGSSVEVMQVSSARTYKDLFFLFCQIVLFVGNLVNQNAGKKAKELANKSKCWQTNQNADEQTKILTNKPKF